jgi:uncharacterized protein (TIGR02271 family)
MNDPTNHARVSDFTDRTVVDPTGDKVGTVFDVYLDRDTDQPEWLAVSTGMFGTKISFVPLHGVGFDDRGNVVVAYEKRLIKDAPRAEADGQLSAEEERELYSHYGRPYQTADLDASRDDDSVGDRASMVRSEEELSIDKHRHETGRVKLRKWVETEQVQVTVPVERQMAKVVREPVRDGDGSGEFVEGEEEIVLSEEVVDVSKRAVAKERVGLETETVTDRVVVDEAVRKERVDVDGDALQDAERRDR